MLELLHGEKNKMRKTKKNRKGVGGMKKVGHLNGEMGKGRKEGNIKGRWNLEDESRSERNSGVSFGFCVLFGDREKQL